MTSRRKEPFENGQFHHIHNQSIDQIRIFTNPGEYLRFCQMILYFSLDASLPKFSQFIVSKKCQNRGFVPVFSDLAEQNSLRVEVAAYCLLPDRFHLMLKQVSENGISAYLSDLQNAYSRYFNNSRKRIGPLWRGRFKNEFLESNEQCLLISRRIHQSPIREGLCDHISEWNYSSYRAWVHEELDYASQILKEAALSGEDYRNYVLEGVSQLEKTTEIADISILS